jgi:hypothetical protein
LTKKVKVKKPEMVLFKPPGEKLAHIFRDGFKGGVGKTLCGRTIWCISPIALEEYAASIQCKICDDVLRFFEEHKGEK